MHPHTRSSTASCNLTAVKPFPSPKNRFPHFSHRKLAMISSKRLLQMVRKWQKIAASERRRISWSKRGNAASMDTCSSSMASKGNFVVYSQDGRRFVVPLKYINNNIFKELFEISREEFGLPCDSPIMMPCDAILMEYVISLLPRKVSKDMEMALLSTIAGIRCSMSSMCPQEFAYQQLLVHGY